MRMQTYNVYIYGQRTSISLYPELANLLAVKLGLDLNDKSTVRNAFVDLLKTVQTMTQEDMVCRIIYRDKLY